MEAGVLAILNEYNREPTSVPLTNANEEHLRFNSFSQKSQTISMSNNIKLYENEMQKKLDEIYYVSNIINKNILPNISETKIDTNDKNIMGYNHESDTKEEYLLKKKQFKLVASIDHNLTHINSNLLKNIKDPNKIVFSDILLNEEESKSKSKNILNKVTILNEVLQSPWKSRLPHNFTPMRRRDCNLTMLPSSEDVTTVLADDSLGIHVGQHSSHYTCVECNKSFSQLRNFKYHMSVHRGTKEFATTCPVCGKYFNDKGYLSSHMKIHKNCKEYKCSLCPKSFNQRVAYNMHVRIHTGIKPHVCDECGKAFSRKMLLKQHQRTHSGERPYACSYCNKRFADRSNMTLHLRLHTGVKPFNCPLCSKSFTKKHHLKSHLNIHTGDKPFSCPRCNLAFTQSSNMRTHYKKCSTQPTNNDI